MLAKAARLDPLHQISLQQVRFATRLNGFKGLYLEQAAHQLVHFMRDQHPSHRRGQLQPVGGIDRIAQGRVLTGGADRAQEDRASVNGNAHRKTLASKRPQPGLLDILLDLQRSQHSPFWIILLGRTCPPQSHHRIADMLIDHAALGHDGAVYQVPQSIDGVGNIFGVLIFSRSGKPRDIGKQHRCPFTLLFGRPVLQSKQALTNGRLRGIHYRIP